jgi:serine/threonine-protein kinase HipA
VDREAFVYMDIAGVPILVGRLWSRIRKQRETGTFEYDAGWLKRPDRFALEPALILSEGPYHSGAARPMFGAIGDSAPDRWGRALMRRAERKAAEREGRPPRTLFEIDFLLQVDDEVRAGALRFAEKLGGPFVAEPGKFRIPPLVELNRLLAAAERVIDNKDDEDDLRLLIAPGSSLGGARPKASVRDADGHLSIAKFPHKEDSCNVVLWEHVTLALAARAGIAVSEWHVAEVGKKACLILRRFDRRNGTRVPLLSAMSMLGASDNESDHTYLDIAEALRQQGAAPNEDLRELWRRIVLNVLVSNTDDHLRNHAFLYESQKGWRLSPAYDINPVPLDVRPRILSTAIDPADNRASIDLAFAAAEYFGLNKRQAKTIAAEVGAAVTHWREEAKNVDIAKSEIDRMATAFEHDDLKKALGK